MTAAKQDGRRARGAARRRQLVDAALVVLGRDGVAGLTHRAVAEQAGVPLASASYHFAGIDDLIVTALVSATDDIAALIENDGGDRSLARLAQLLADEIHTHRELLLAEYELYLLAARRPSLRPAALAWLDVVADAFAPQLNGVERRAFQATLEGVLLHALLGHINADAAEIHAKLEAAWPCRPTP